MHSQFESLQNDSSDATWIGHLETETKSIVAQLVSVRRHLHQNPELSMREFHTTEYLANLIADHGLPVSKTSFGVGFSCELEHLVDSHDAPKIGIRGDIDALPLETMSKKDYASKKKGAMHACGHDAHAAMAYGATILISQMAKNGLLPWPVSTRTIFQPAEETAQGGLLMINEGMLNGLSAAIALHVEPNLTVGHVATRAGVITAGCTSFEVTIAGSSGHSARPYLAADALAAGVQFVNQVYITIPRCHDCRDSAVVNFGSFHSGTAANVVTNSAALTGTVRTLNEHTKKSIFDRMAAIAQSVMIASNTKIDLTILNDTPSLKNNSALALEVLSIARRLPRIESATELPLPSMGAEDFAFIAAKVPSCLVRLGTGSRDGTNCFPLHSTSFDLDEDALGVGAQLLAAAAINACRPREQRP